MTVHSRINGASAASSHLSPYDLGRAHGSTKRHPHSPPTTFTPNQKADYSQGFDAGVDSLAFAKKRKAQVHPMVLFSFS